MTHLDRPRKTQILAAMLYLAERHEELKIRRVYDNGTYLFSLVKVEYDNDRCTFEKEIQRVIFEKDKSNLNSPSEETL